jgi:hypothetical protein
MINPFARTYCPFSRPFAFGRMPAQTKISWDEYMSLVIKPNQEAKIAELAAKTGRDQADVLVEVIESYFDELSETRKMLDRRYDEFKSGRVAASTPEQIREDIERRKREFLQRRHES